MDDGGGGGEVGAGCGEGSTGGEIGDDDDWSEMLRWDISDGGHDGESWDDGGGGGGMMVGCGEGAECGEGSDGGEWTELWTRGESVGDAAGSVGAGGRVSIGVIGIMGGVIASVSTMW